MVVTKWSSTKWWCQFKFSYSFFPPPFLLPWRKGDVETTAAHISSPGVQKNGACLPTSTQSRKHMPNRIHLELFFELERINLSSSQRFLYCVEEDSITSSKKNLESFNTRKRATIHFYTPKILNCLYHALPETPAAGVVTGGVEWSPLIGQECVPPSTCYDTLRYNNAKFGVKLTLGDTFFPELNFQRFIDHRGTEGGITWSRNLIILENWSSQHLFLLLNPLWFLTLTWMRVSASFDYNHSIPRSLRSVARQGVWNGNIMGEIGIKIRIMYNGRRGS